MAKKLIGQPCRWLLSRNQKCLPGRRDNLCATKGESCSDPSNWCCVQVATSSGITTCRCWRPLMGCFYSCCDDLAYQLEFCKDGLTPCCCCLTPSCSLQKPTSFLDLLQPMIHIGRMTWHLIGWVFRTGLAPVRGSRH